MYIGMEFEPQRHSNHSLMPCKDVNLILHLEPNLQPTPLKPHHLSTHTPSNPNASLAAPSAVLAFRTQGSVR